MFYKLKQTYFISIISLFLVTVLTGQEAIRLNQIGFYPNGPKWALALETLSDTYYITSIDGADTLYSESLKQSPFNALYGRF